ncbi:MAG: endonuclease/exonuclease/phosphatase family protein [Candidatus Cloacimonetes bacterium]|nr:endonuclease/exonuclease/phosphatase family protein [Candidatus Cloacimonadota bacterium]
MSIMQNRAKGAARYRHRPLLFYLLFLAAFFLLFSCGENHKLTPPPSGDSILLFGSDNTLDIITWNLQTFPLAPSTIDLLADIIPQMQAEVIAFQEIMDAASFYELADRLPEYEAFVYNATASWRLAYLYDKRSISVKNAYTIYNGQSNPFPRPPYVLEMSYAGKDYYLINNHFKALGDNYIDETDPWDEEVRRRLASALLDQYIREHLDNERVVVLGDLNDQIQEPIESNVFMPFLSRPDEYLFATMSIAQNPSPDIVSYPSYNSMIDHILISNELFSEYSLAGEICRVIRVENYVGGLSRYYNTISDHRPVGIRLQAW